MSNKIMAEEEKCPKCSHDKHEEQKCDSCECTG